MQQPAKNMQDKDIQQKLENLKKKSDELDQKVEQIMQQTNNKLETESKTNLLNSQSTNKPKEIKTDMQTSVNQQNSDQDVQEQSDHSPSLKEKAFTVEEKKMLQVEEIQVRQDQLKNNQNQKETKEALKIQAIDISSQLTPNNDINSNSNQNIESEEQKNEENNEKNLSPSSSQQTIHSIRFLTKSPKKDYRSL